MRPFVGQSRKVSRAVRDARRRVVYEAGLVEPDDICSAVGGLVVGHKIRSKMDKDWGKCMECGKQVW